jgi:hypothetical protein
MAKTSLVDWCSRCSGWTLGQVYRFLRLCEWDMLSMFLNVFELFIETVKHHQTRSARVSTYTHNVFPSCKYDQVCTYNII